MWLTLTIIIIICAWISVWARREIEANARLIAAAPEMFEALQCAYNSLEDRYQQNVLCVADEDLFHTITNLIGKIRGNQ